MDPACAPAKRRNKLDQALPVELMLEITCYLQPSRYEATATLPDAYNEARWAAHRASAAVGLVSRAFGEFMRLTARVVLVKYSFVATFADKAHPFGDATFPYAKFFDARDAQTAFWWVDDAVLGSLHQVMPNLRGVDLSGACKVTSRGVRALVESTALEVYHGGWPVTTALCNAIAAAPLTTLQLALRGACDGALDGLDDHPTLKRLTLSYECEVLPVPPINLPNLEALAIAVSPQCRFEDWDDVASISCPRLKTLAVDDRTGDELDNQSMIFHALTPRVLNGWMTQIPALESCHVAGVAKVVLFTCTTCHGGERVMCFRAPPGVELTFSEDALPQGFRVVVDIDTAPLTLAVAVWDHEAITSWEATSVPLG